MDKSITRVPKGSDLWGLLRIGASEIPFPGIAASMVVADEIQRRAGERLGRKRHERAARYIEHLNRRLNEVVSELDEERVDLFDEVFVQVVVDDDSGKEHVYAAILAWILAEREPAATVRIIVDAVERLTSPEIQWFLDGTVLPRQELPGVSLANSSVFWSRVEAVGFLGGTNSIKRPREVSVFGLKLRQIVERYARTPESHQS